MRISIITPSYNQARFLERTIDSVISQSGPFELEYLVLDGGSTDGSVAILRRYGDRFWWRSAPDGGQVDAINAGLKLATGDVVAWLNSDDTLLPGALVRVADTFAERPDALWMHGRCRIIDEDDRPIRRWVDWYKHRCAQRHSFGRLLTENYVSQMTAFWRRSVHERVGLLDASVPLAFDYDLWLRLAMIADPVYVPDYLACFRWYDVSKSGANFARQAREDMAVSLRHMPPHSGLIRGTKRTKLFCALAVYRALAVGRRVARTCSAR
jgi:glycosyltransferase involved in cell wall biosynthesis